MAEKTKIFGQFLMGLSLVVAMGCGGTESMDELNNIETGNSNLLKAQDSVDKGIPPKASVSSIISYGAKNNVKDVMVVEGRLIELGYLKGEPTGEYDKRLVVSVANFKRDNLIKGDGTVVDERTLNAMGIAYVPACGGPNVRCAAPGTIVPVSEPVVFNPR